MHLDSSRLTLWGLVVVGVAFLAGLFYHHGHSFRLLGANSFGPNAFACDDSLYLMRSSTIYTVDETTPGTYELNEVSTNGYNSLGFNPQDGYMYGMNGNDVIQITTVGQTNLGSVPLTVNVFSGTFLADGTYIVNGAALDGDSPLFHIDVAAPGGPELIKTVTMTERFADIARNPVDGQIYGFANGPDQLARIHPHTGEVTLIGDPQGAVINSAGAAFFQADGTLFLYGATPVSVDQDTLFTADVTTGVVTVVDVIEAVSGSDGASCVMGVDAPDPEAVEPIVFNGAGQNQSAPTITTVSVCAGEEDGPKQCARAFPTHPVGGLDPLVTAYEACVEGGTAAKICAHEWAKAKGYSLCNSDDQCASTDGALFVLPEVETDYENGCFTYNEEVYCPHETQGHCLEVDGEIRCQSRDQKCVMQRVAYDKTQWPSEASYIQTRNNVQLSFEKFCVYDRAEEGDFDVELTPAQASFGSAATVNVCKKAGTAWDNGPALILPHGNCVTTYPLEGASKYYDRYAACRKRGMSAEECTQLWASGMGMQQCMSHEGCL